MKTYELVYLLNNEMRKSISLKPDKASYIASAYKNVENKIKNEFGNNDNIENDLINRLSITDYMKNKVNIIIKKPLSKETKKKIKEHKIKEDLTNIAGIGSHKANKLIKEGIKKISDITKKKYYSQLNDSTKLLINYKPQRCIQHNDIKKIENLLVGFPNVVIVGSYRRKKEKSRDIDIMITSNESNKVDEYINYLIKKFSNVLIYSKGEDKASLLIEIYDKKYYKIDIFRTRFSNKNAMLLYSTGPKDFNIKMRRIASKMGYLLNQNGLYIKETMKKVPIKTEKGFFRKLNMGYINPENR